MDTDPVGVLAPLVRDTAPLIVTGEPCTKLALDVCNVVCELASNTLFHALARLAAFTDPRPVARS